MENIIEIGLKINGKEFGEKCIIKNLNDIKKIKEDLNDLVESSLITINKEKEALLYKK